MDFLYPARFDTGIKKRTILNPCNEFAGVGDTKVFQGVADDYDFKHQSSNFLRLQKVLKDNGTELGPLVAATYSGWASSWNNKMIRLTRFVTCSKDGRLMWEKYEGKTSGGGQNHVYVAGMKIKLTDFLELGSREQWALLTWDPVLIALVFEPKLLKRIDVYNR